MNIKRIFAIVLSAFMILSLAACKGNSKVDVIEETSTTDISEEITDAVSDEIFAETTLSSADIPTTSAQVTTEVATDPAEWSKEQIIEIYKNAAKKSNASAKSEQGIELKNISVNNGEYEGLFDFIMPIMSKLLENNSSEKDGITGGYNNLVASDVASAKAYKVGNNIAIEMVMKEQVSGARDDALSGSVGHAITAVGDISVVTKQLDDLGLPIEISEKDTKIYYTNPVVKVLINSNGEIVNGTWRYTVEINLNNYTAFGKAVKTTSVVMDNIITVNGGFKK